VAHLKFHNLPGLERRFNKLVTEHLLPTDQPGALTALPWDQAMAADDVKAAAADRAPAAFAGRARRSTLGTTSHLMSNPHLLNFVPPCDISSAVCGALFAGLHPEDASPPAVTLRAFLGFLKAAGALIDGAPAGVAVVIGAPEVAADEDGEETSEADSPGKSGEESGMEAAEEAAAAIEEEEEAVVEPAGPSLSTVEAMLAFTAALGPAAAVAAAEAAAEAKEADAQAAYECGEEVDAAAATAAAAAAEEKAATELMLSLDCEATYTEFVEALARCADVALKGDTPLAAKLAVFLGDGLKL
jgi:hypothetical protein